MQLKQVYLIDNSVNLNAVRLLIKNEKHPDKPHLDNQTGKLLLLSKSSRTAITSNNIVIRNAETYS